MTHEVIIQDVPHTIDEQAWTIGKFAIWSSSVDCFIYFDGTEEEIVEFFALRAAELARQDYTRFFKNSDNCHPASEYIDKAEKYHD